MKTPSDSDDQWARVMAFVILMAILFLAYQLQRAGVLVGG